jgi:hypothetical protein
METRWLGKVKSIGQNKLKEKQGFAFVFLSLRGPHTGNDPGEHAVIGAYEEPVLRSIRYERDL